VLGSQLGDVGGTWLAPSVLGSGVDVVVSRDDAAAMRDALRAHGLVQAEAEDVEAWRILAGSPRMGTDFGPDALPAEVGLEYAIDLTKGCFLGQESVARVRNLGHPRSTLRHVRTPGVLDVGAAVMSGGQIAGTVTSATPDGPFTVAIVRVRWAFASSDLAGENGEAMIGVGSSG
jgi:folate-binding protein YgfZ